MCVARHSFAFITQHSVSQGYARSFHGGKLLKAFYRVVMAQRNSVDFFVICNSCARLLVRFFFFLVLTKRDKRILHETLETTLCSIRTAAQERQKKHGARQQATQSRKGAMCTYGTRGGGQATRDLVTRAVRSLGHQDSFTQQHVRLGVEQYDIQHDWLQQVLPPAHSVT